MIRAAAALSSGKGRRPMINTQRGEFEATVAGELCRFDTRLSTIAAIEAACGNRAVVEVLNGIILGRRAQDQIDLIGAALACADPPRADAEDLAARATVAEAEAFVLALVFALGFKVAARQGESEAGDPLDHPGAGVAGESSRSAA
jgi:hypothetical protein